MNPKFMSAPEREAYRIGYERGRQACEKQQCSFSW